MAPTRRAGSSPAFRTRFLKDDMKTFLILIFCFISLAVAGSILEGSIVVRSDGNNVTIQWGSADESNVREFVIERRSSDVEDFTQLAILPPKGSNSFYEYIDQSAFKTTASLYHYRIRTDLKNGTSIYSDEKTVSLNVSSVKRTWGSLKAMFR